MSNTEKNENEKVVDLPVKEKTHIESIELKNKKIKYFIKIYAFTLFVIIIAYTAYLNPSIFTLHKDTLSLITEAYNLIVILLVPFVFGSIGASARILISGMLLGKSLKLVFSSGLIATFSWLGVKSKIFLALLTPYLAEGTLKGDESISTTLNSNSEIYSLALVAVLVGMFASNIYIFIEQRVELLTNKANKTL